MLSMMSKLGAYLADNLRMKNPEYDDKFELCRVVFTWYRCGAHNLMSEMGRRTPQIPQDERLCKSKTDEQTPKHVIMNCPLLHRLREEHNRLDVKSGKMNDLCLMEIEKTSEIK